MQFIFISGWAPFSPWPDLLIWHLQCNRGVGSLDLTGLEFYHKFWTVLGTRNHIDGAADVRWREIPCNFPGTLSEQQCLQTAFQRPQAIGDHIEIRFEFWRTLCTKGLQLLGVGIILRGGLPCALTHWPWIFLAIYVEFHTDWQKFLIPSSGLRLNQAGWAPQLTVPNTIFLRGRLPCTDWPIEFSQTWGTWIFTQHTLHLAFLPHFQGVGSLTLTGLRNLLQFIWFSISHFIFAHWHYLWRVFTLLLANGALKWLTQIGQTIGLFLIFLLHHHAFQILGANWTQRSCRSGPNSRRSSDKLVRRLGSLTLLAFFLQLNCWGEGSVPAMGGTEVHCTFPESTTKWTKRHGMQPPMCNRTLGGPDTAHGNSKVEKRSLLRAYKRSLTVGSAWYRGKHYTSDTLERMGCRLRSPTHAQPLTPGLQSDWQKCNSKHGSKGRIKFWQWNSGGLASHTMDEVKAWLVMNCVDIGIIVETRLSFDSHWTDKHWHHIHSGEGGNRGKGILILISKRMCQMNQLRWQIHDSGRLIHLRMQLQPRAIDLVACYQHTFQATRRNQQARDQWWTLLAQVLSGLPNRHCLILAGDFNCSVPASPGCVGTSKFAWRGNNVTGTYHGDHPKFLQILRDNALTVLNSWTASAGPTYVHCDQASRIDHICVRQSYADGEAKNVQHLWHSPFLNQTEVGHVPLLTTIAKYWIPDNRSDKIHNVTLQQRQMSRQAFLSQSDTWREFTTVSQQLLLDHLRAPVPDADAALQSLHREMLSSFCHFFPKGRQTRPASPWQTALGTILNKWDHRRLMRKPRVATLHSVFQGWFHAARFSFLKRFHRRQSKELRNQQFEEVVMTAAQAAAQHDTHKLFHVINRFAPKQPRKQIQIRTSQGHLATPIESAAIINQFVTDTWSGPRNLGLQFARPPGVPFSLQQLEKALSLIPVTKATAKPFAPGMVWRQLASSLAPMLFDLLQDWWGQTPPIIPAAWRHGWLFLIPKPLKPPVTPLHLRPLALQEPVGKAVIGLLIHQAMQDARFHMVQFPIWSYMEHRSTFEAIRRVSQHCADVPQLIQLCRSTPHARATRAPKVGLYGGVQLCIDLQRAFDGVNRVKLFTRLHELHIREEIIQLLAYWHEATDYFVQHDLDTTQIPIGRGVRQGCKAAPGLWNSFMVLLLHDLNMHIPLSWIQNCLTIYADDFHVGTSFTCMEEFCLFHHFIGILFLTMQSLDMSINPGKSVALIELRGSESKAARARFVRRDHNGDSLKIIIPGGAAIHIPICKSTKYLGVIISYGSFEDCSLKHRLKLMHVGFRRLQRWLTGKHSLNLQQRFQLWQTCIYPIFSYGLFATGMTQHGLKQAITQMTVMMRRVLHDHAYVTRRSNSTAFSRVQIPTPAQLLHGTALALLRTLHNRKMHLLTHDLAHTIQWTHLPELVRLLTQLQETTFLETPSQTLPEAWNVPFFQCAHCDFCTTDVSAYRRHYTQMHSLPMNRTQYVQPDEFALDGLPTCKFCMTTFSTWRMFYTHIERGCQELLAGPRSHTVIPGCRGAALGTIAPKMHQHPSDAAARGLHLITEEELHHLKSLPFGDRLLQIVQERDWTKVEQAQDVCRYLATRCVICSHQFSRCQELHQHYRLQHPVLWEHVPPKAIQLTNLFCTDSPCPCCGALFTTHSCPTWSQIAVLLVNGAGLEPTEETATTEARQRCELCLLCFPSPADLVQHLQTAHGLQGLSFNGSRDSIDNSSACAHCGQLFLTMAGLKSHIVQGRCQFFNPQASAETK